MKHITLILNFQRLVSEKRCKFCKYISESKNFWKKVATYYKRFNDEF